MSLEFSGGTVAAIVVITIGAAGAVVLGVFGYRKFKKGKKLDRKLQEIDTELQEKEMQERTLE
jgi:hypothetical protein